MKLSVFYSWQSDRPSKLCREFIQIALHDAAERLAARRNVEVVVDSDTQGVPGTPPITAVILEKIGACDVFVADMSFVAETTEAEVGGETKKLTNPNVMGEFGYALSQKGWRRILLVMNEAYGPAKSLPFDLGHFRKPATYNVATEKPDAGRRSARSALSARLEANLEAVLDDLIEMPPSAPDWRGPLTELWTSTQNARISNDPPTVVPGPSAAIYVVPAGALDPPPLHLPTINTARHLLTPASDIEAVQGQSHTQWWAYGPARRHPVTGNRVSAWCARLLRPGVVEHILNLGEPYEGDTEVLVNGFTVEKRVIVAVDRSLSLLQAIGLAGPYLIAVSFYDLEPVRLTGRGGAAGRFRQPSLWTTPALVADGQTHSGNHLREIFDQFWLAAGVADGSLSFVQTGQWAGYLPNNAY